MRPMKIKCIIVDDEPLAIEAIEMHLSEYEDVDIIARCKNAPEAFTVLKEKEVDLMFLDINMPKLTGLDFLSALKQPPEVIITTAYNEYALKGYELDVVDYLLKPVSFERFMMAMDKFYRRKKSSGNNHETIVKPENEYIFIRANRENVKVGLSSILYLENIKDYVKVVTTGNRFLTKNNLGSFEKILPEKKFVRAHRSFIVGIDAITSFSADTIKIGQTEIPVSRGYRENVISRLQLGTKLIK